MKYFFTASRVLLFQEYCDKKQYTGIPLSFNSETEIPMTIILRKCVNMPAIFSL